MHPANIIPYKLPAFNSLIYVAGGFLALGLTELLFIMSGRLNSDYYISTILPEIMRKCSRHQLLLLQDGHAHFSVKTRRYLDNRVQISIHFGQVTLLT